MFELKGVKHTEMAKCEKPIHGCHLTSQDKNTVYTKQMLQKILSNIARCGV